MGIYAPAYYTRFACRGGACRHTCCRGWEIDIDAETYAVYQKTPGDIGNRLRENIVTDGEGAHFRLLKDERCPFLNHDNLCDLILELGEQSLCQICRDHPRYRNFFESRTEIGLGLSCESAAALILEGEEKPSMVCISGEADGEIPEDEAYFFALREEILDVIFKAESIADLACCFGVSLPSPGDYYPIYRGLTVLHKTWHEKLSRLLKTRKAVPHLDMPTRQLIAYFVCRHLADCFFDGRLHVGLAFCLHGAELVLYASDSETDFLETARQYSEEIEYAAENMESIFNMLESMQTEKV